jgi:hypothetical protein
MRAWPPESRLTFCSVFRQTASGVRPHQNVNAKDIFGIILRVIGVGYVGYGLHYVLSLGYVAMHHNASAEWSSFDYLLAGVYYLFIGLCLLRGSRYVVRFAYPREGDDDSRAP